MKAWRFIGTVFLYLFFSVYLFLLLYVLFFSRMSFGGGQTITRSINVIPFHSIYSYLAGNLAASGNLAFQNVFWNIGMFIPLGIYLPVFAGGKNRKACVAAIFLFSLLAEVLQFSFGIGVADIDDIILNGIGGILGLIIYKILLIMFKKTNRIRLLVTIVAVIVGAPVLFIMIATYLYNR